MATAVPSSVLSQTHEDHGPAILAVSLSTTIAAVIYVSVRTYIRLRLTHSFWWDDGFIAAAAALSVTGAAFSIICIQNGAGKHTYDLSDPLVQVPRVIKWNTAYQIDNVLCVNLVKVMFIMSAINLVTLAIFASQCRPLAKLWNTPLPGVCSDHSRILQIGYAQGVSNVLTDLFCTTTPVFVLWKVQISTRLKVVICGLMSLGLTATASQIVRVITLSTLLEKDYSHGITTIFIAAILDQNLGIIAACIPTFQPLFRSLAATVRGVGHRLHSSRELSYRVLPEKVRRHDHGQEEAFNLPTLTSRPVIASNSPERLEASRD